MQMVFLGLKDMPAVGIYLLSLAASAKISSKLCVCDSWTRLVDMHRSGAFCGCVVFYSCGPEVDWSPDTVELTQWRRNGVV